MIAACPKCAARYRIDPAKLRPEGVRLRCSKCEAVFRVRPPADAPPTAAPAVRSEAPTPPPAPEPAPSAPADGPLVLVGTPDAETGKALEAALAGWGARSMVVADGVEAILEIQRQLPAAVVLAATLPKMFGFQICELVKRNESLREIGVVLLGAIHHKDRYRRPPSELYGADAYVEEPDLPDALLPALQRLGVAIRAGGGAQTRPTAPPPPVSAPQAPAPAAAPAAPAPRAPAPDDEIGQARSQAERLARIIVSDIVLYNEEKFAAAVSAGNVARVMAADLDEGRALFEERIDERLRGERDFLTEELVRVARSRGMAD